MFEVTDERRPRLTRVRAAGGDGAARVRFRLDEPGRVTVRLERGSRGYARTVRCGGPARAPSGCAGWRPARTAWRSGRATSRATARA